MNRQSARHEVCLGRQHVAIFSDARDLTASFEVAKTLPQGNSFAPFQCELPCDLGPIERAVILPPQKSQDLFLNVTSVYGHGVEQLSKKFALDVARFQSKV